MEIFKWSKKNERRKSDRYDFYSHIEFLLIDLQTNQPQSDQPVKAKILNLSSGGMLIDKSHEYGTGGLLLETELDIELGSHIRVTMKLPIPGIESEFTVDCEVLHKDKINDIVQLGVKFLKIVHHNILKKMRYDILLEILHLKEKEKRQESGDDIKSFNDNSRPEEREGYIPRADRENESRDNDY